MLAPKTFAFRVDDQGRVLFGDQSPDWIKTFHHSQNATSEFYTVGSVETGDKPRSRDEE